jgi:hypothetical protein
MNADNQRYFKVHLPVIDNALDVGNHDRRL